MNNDRLSSQQSLVHDDMGDPEVPIDEDYQNTAQVYHLAIFK